MLKISTRQQGSALISALFITTLVAIVVTAMSTRLMLDIYRTHLTITSDKLYLASQAVSFWGLSVLADKKNQFTHSDSHGKVLEFPTKLQGIYPGTVIKGSLYDLQSHFNLNNLVVKQNQFLFVKLLENTTKLSSSRRKALSMALSNWLSPYQPSQRAKLSFSYYSQQKPPYFPAQQLMQNVSEFRLVQGVSPKVYRTLSDYITVLPKPAPINLNTAPKQLLMALGDGLNATQVDELITARGKTGIVNPQKLAPLLKKLNIRDEQVTIESQYFMTIATITTEDLRLINYSIIKRSKDKNGKISVILLSSVKDHADPKRTRQKPQIVAARSIPRSPRF
jgi:general secretion pathway protein K